MTLVELIQGWIRKPSVPLLTYTMDSTRIDKNLSQAVLEAHRHYVRIRLARMYLKDDVRWFQQWFPAVQSHIKFQFGDGTVELPNVADSERAKLQKDDSAALIIKNVPLTPTVPFHGGVLEMSASLIAVKGENGLNNFVNVLSGFAEVLQVPQISAAVGIAKPLISGMSVMLKVANDHLHLGYFNSFSAGQLSDGYIVVLRAPSASVDRSQHCIVNDELWVEDASEPNGKRPFTDCDYMLLRTEVFQDRDDWEALTFISKPWQEVQQAVSEQGPDWEKLAATRFRLVLLRVAQAQELTRMDRIRIGKTLQDEFAQMKEYYGAVHMSEKARPTFEQLARNASTVSIDEREPSIEEWLSQV